MEPRQPRARIDFRDLPLFEGLDDDELRRIGETLRRRTFPRGARLFVVEPPGDLVYVVLEGVLKIAVDAAPRRDVVVALKGRGDVLGELSGVEMIELLGRPATAVTLTRATLVWTRRAIFERFLETMPRLTRNFVEVLSRRVRAANEQVAALATLNVDGRVARELLHLADAYGEPNGEGAVVIPIQLTQQDVAGLVGASRERVNKVLGTYRRAGWIGVDGASHVTVRDAGSLARQFR
ncbi:MAG: Crp/Fnr family transcriptional regulator [Thermoleophilia bacterium]|nr:Crp/Fnr family transcriptional regulator [Thermoleophilia bacterium]